MGWKGVLDHIDHIDRMLARLARGLVETTDPAVIRQQRILVQNMRTTLNETRRMLERTGQETET